MAALLAVMNKRFHNVRTYRYSKDVASTSARDVKQLKVVGLARRNRSTLALITFPPCRVGDIIPGAVKGRAEQHSTLTPLNCPGHIRVTKRFLKVHESVNFEGTPL